MQLAWMQTDNYWYAYHWRLYNTLHKMCRIPTSWTVAGDKRSTPPVIHSFVEGIFPDAPFMQFNNDFVS